MKFRLTPLNIITASGFAILGFLLFQSKPAGAPDVKLDGFYLLIAGCLIAITFITDMIFRFTLKDLKKIWIVESVFIVLTAVLMLLLQK